MQNYEAGKPSYFATPSPQLIHALHTSLTQILSAPLSERFALHRAASQRVKAGIAELGLTQLAADAASQSNSMTAIYLPSGLKVSDLLPKLLSSHQVVFAGGLHRAIAPTYFRIGHMGVSATDPNRTDIQRALQALKASLVECGYAKASGGESK
ncbi:MAG: hypothetical protein M1838_005881 [Thelocarpon superellum]|nr:MAG: hypothetical protein M1838_005881 [Thelocarpon superellum]